MRRYSSLPIEKLVSDVAVDLVHVRELADSIKVSGPISPVLVREENLALIDGFHRVAAMKELGFNQVECILTPCDDEMFWDLRILSATLHRAVTFARVIDWIEEVFKASTFAKRYSSSHSLFSWAKTGTETPKDVRQWAEDKARKWGLSVHTIEDWLFTKKKLAPELLAEARVSPPRGGEGLSVAHYRTVADVLPRDQDLQRKVIDKAKREDLTTAATRELAKAVKRAEDEGEVQSILRQPVSRTEDQMVREAKVEKILSYPREITPLEKYQEAKHEEVLYKLDLLGIINNSKAQTPEKISALTPAQKADVYHTCEEAIIEIRRVMDMIKATVQPEYLLKEG